MAIKQNETLKITNEMSLYLRYLHQKGNITCKLLSRHYSQYAVRSIYRHVKKKSLLKSLLMVEKQIRENHQK